MAICFLDRSASVKRYIVETGTAWVQSLTAPSSGNLLYVVRITGAEIIAAITRRERSGGTTPFDLAAAIAAFRTDFTRAYFLLDVSTGLISLAMDIAEHHGLRGYDAVQLAAALELRDQCRLAGLPDPLVITADGDLNAAALAEGLAVENPNFH